MLLFFILLVLCCRGFFIFSDALVEVRLSCVLPLAGIAAIVGGGAIAKLGPSLEKAAKMKRTLALEYSAQKRFLKKEMDVKA